MLSGFSALAQSKYLERHNAVLKVLFFEISRELGLIDSVPPWYSPAVPKAIYESPETLAIWFVSVYAEHKQGQDGQGEQSGRSICGPQV